MLDVSSPAKGLLIPRMSTASVLSISNPAKGLLVYDSSKNQLMVNMGTPASPGWQTIVYNNGWNLTGNGATNPATNFLGTTDLQALHFRINNINAGIIDTLSFNSSMGFRTLDSNTVGVHNAAFGYKALITNSQGSENTAVGSNALRRNPRAASFSPNYSVKIIAIGPQ